MVNDREPILSDLTGDAQLYKQLVQDGVWNQMKSDYNRVNSYVPNFKFGRSGSQSVSNTIANHSNKNVTIVENHSNNINVSTPNAQSFNESRSQIAHREKILRKRNRRNRN